MKFSQLFVSTLKEAPSDAEVISHQLMVRAAYVRKLSSGIYSYLPLLWRVLQKVEVIVREELNKEGAQELLMPQLQPVEIWKESGRFENYTKVQQIMFTLKNRTETEYSLGPTHEEVITSLARSELKSYRQLPQNLYQIQTKFRDEIRPRFGLLRGIEFIMKDGYSFHRDFEDLKDTYQKMHRAYSNIFRRCGLDFRVVEADTGAIGGSASHEFMVVAESGEDTILYCDSCDYAANLEKAISLWLEIPPDHEDQHGLVSVPTPGKKSIEEVAEYLKVPVTKLVKTLIYQTENKETVAVLVRGDQEVNEVKLANELGAAEVKLASEEVVRQVTGAPSGFAGPVGIKIPVILDHTVEPMINFVTGANQLDTHHINVNLKDFHIHKKADIRSAQPGDGCARCKTGFMKGTKGIEVGHIFQLGIKYSHAMQANFTDEDGKEKPFVMGCYGIGVSRLAAAAIEQNHDKDGIIWPVAIAPFQAIVIPVDRSKEEQWQAAQQIYEELEQLGIEAVLDDRDDRAGFKFKDADLIGFPFRINVGKKIGEGTVELVIRRTKETLEVSKDQVAAKMSELMAKELSGNL